jgi:nitroreductase
MLRDLIIKNRSYRRFDGLHGISRAELTQLVELARYSGTGANIQPLKFYLSYTKDKNELIFPLLGWAGYLKDWGGPIEDEKPTAYIIILGDKRIKTNFGVDHGVAAQSIMLGATEKGLGGCMIASVMREDLCLALNLPEYLEILLVLALGKPVEDVILENVGEDGDIKYYRDIDERHHVPKRKLDELIVN